jgi:dienelactone hydrolase
MHAYVMSQPAPGSPYPMYLTFLLTRDEIYLPIVVRRPPGEGPFPAITIGRGNGRGGMPHVVREVERMVPMQDRMIERGYVVAYVNYRNEVPQLYNDIDPGAAIDDDMTRQGRVRRSAPALDSDDLGSVIHYLATLPFVVQDRIGAIGVSHGGEMILKTAAEMRFACGVAEEGASHEFLCVDTGPDAPRKDGEIQYNDIDVVRARADKARAMARIRRIATPILHVGRETDHLQGIFKLAHEWMLEAGKDSTWVSFDHAEHGYAYSYRASDGSDRPDPIQDQVFEIIMQFFDKHLKFRA